MYDFQSYKQADLLSTYLHILMKLMSLGKKILSPTFEYVTL